MEDPSTDSESFSQNVYPNDVLEVVKATSSAYIATLEDRHKSLANDIQQILSTGVERKKAINKLKQIILELQIEKRRQVEAYAEERRRADEKLAVLENQVLNVQIFTSNLNEHNELIRLFLQTWENKMQEIKAKWMR